MKTELKIAQEKLMKVEIENQSNLRDVETIGGQKLELEEEMKRVVKEKQTEIESLQNQLEGLSSKQSEKEELLEKFIQDLETRKLEEIKTLEIEIDNLKQ